MRQKSFKIGLRFHLVEFLTHDADVVGDSYFTATLEEKHECFLTYSLYSILLKQKLQLA